ncbi:MULTISPECIES: peptidase domain-containing ABC transporter [unclassified Pseudomonas]|uniref:peptidase domain-containing ABC transporter n=1 Tax=unclassified Pseudomonas TaxID=196821 RepID=UPI0015A30637|nr:MULTISPECIES: ATP-binding cassette domain-containing protein [unclassified Pseudomonas]NWC93093.1 ATP-binding cassette domain-containing protein [Pseudomonas sp. IPO3779]NWD19511.1 ATP-binding cassette domain-containing protein [Pseudomonas sp. IPO3778]
MSVPFDGAVQAPRHLRLLRAIAPFAVEIGVSSLLINACGLLMPVFSMLVYDKVVGNGNDETLWTLGAGMVLVLMLEFVLRMTRSYAAERLGAVAELRMDGRLVDRVLQANAQQVAAPGVLMSRYRDLAGARDALLAQYAIVAADLPFLLMFLVALGFIGGPLVVVPVLYALPIMLGQWFTSRPQRDYAARGQVASASKATLLSEMVGALAFLQTSPLRHVFADRWEKEVLQGAVLRSRQRFWQTASQGWGGMCVGLASVTLLASGVLRIEAGAMSVGSLIACSLIQLRAMMQIASVVSLALGWKDLSRTQRELDAAAMPQPQSSSCETSAPAGPGNISVLHLTCRSQQGDSALHDVNLQIAQGERVAIIGRPGSGKSTLLRCLAGIQVPSDGQVLVSGMRIQAFAADERSQWMAYKPQEPIIMGPTLQDDLAHLQGERAEQALLQTGLGAMLCDGEMRRDQVLSASAGQPLSGGQRQIVALARALASDAQIFLLDEPTSGVDAETENRLTQAVDQLTRGRTVVIATHSTAILNKMDKIVVLERGKVVAYGPPAQLFAPAGALAS